MTLVMDGSFLPYTEDVRPSRVGVGVFEDEFAARLQTGIRFNVGAGGPPLWLDEVIRRLNVAVAAASAEGWRPMTQLAIVRALQVLRDVMEFDSIRPSLTPTPERGLQFEWHDAGWDIEIEVGADGTVETWGRHQNNGSTFDGPLASTAGHVRIALKDITLHHRSYAD